MTAKSVFYFLQAGLCEIGGIALIGVAIIYYLLATGLNRHERLSSLSIRLSTFIVSTLLIVIIQKAFPSAEHGRPPCLQ